MFQSFLLFYCLCYDFLTLILLYFTIFFQFLGIGPFLTFFFVLLHYHIIDSSHATLLAFKIVTIEHRTLERQHFGFNVFDTPFSKKLITFLQLSLTVDFTLSFHWYEITWTTTFLINNSRGNQ